MALDEDSFHLQPGQTIRGRRATWKIGKLLGQGGSGIVYAAKCNIDSRPFAIKLPRNWRSVMDIYQECRWANRRNRNRLKGHDDRIAKIHGTETFYIHNKGFDVPVLLLSLYPGTIYDFVRLHGPVSPILGATWILQVATSLFETELVHRDVKPDNIMVDVNGQARIADFGLAIPDSIPLRRRLGIEIGGSIVGTAFYMPPEQIFGSESVNFLADIYSLGLILYEVLVGKTARPTVAYVKNKAKYLDMMLDYTIPWRDVRHPELAEIVRLCTELVPANRFQHYYDLFDALESIPGVHLNGPPKPSLPVPCMWPQR
jgi:eukaryotic-like serine/threonine-protein kinase